MARPKAGHELSPKFMYFSVYRTPIGTVGVTLSMYLEYLDSRYSSSLDSLLSLVIRVRVQHWCCVRFLPRNRPDVTQRFRGRDRRDCRLMYDCHFVRVCRSAYRVYFRRDYSRCCNCRHRRESPRDLRVSGDRSFDFRCSHRRCCTSIQSGTSYRLLLFLPS